MLFNMLFNSTIQIIPTNKYIYGFYSTFFFKFYIFLTNTKSLWKAIKAAFNIIPPNSLK